MCTIPPPVPPPPPPPPSLQTKSDYLQPLQYRSDSSHKFLDVCKWATHEQQLWEACAKYNLSLYQTPYKYKYKHIETILQVGPTCGLYALSMLVKGQISATDILEMAKMAGYSNNGEMFSCKNMLELALKVLRLANLKNINCTLRKGGLYSNELIERLLNGSILLVPYDADCNHSPCLKQGHKSHWAIVCGVVIPNEPGEDYTTDPCNIHVLCKHGKSKYLAIWRLDDLAKSNKNLWEFYGRAKNDKMVYVMPDGGIGGKNGLRDQYLIFDGF